MRFLRAFCHWFKLKEALSCRVRTTPQVPSWVLYLFFFFFSKDQCQRNSLGMITPIVGCRGTIILRAKFNYDGGGDCELSNGLQVHCHVLACKSQAWEGCQEEGRVGGVPQQTGSLLETQKPEKQ